MEMDIVIFKLQVLETIHENLSGFTLCLNIVLLQSICSCHE